MPSVPRETQDHECRSVLLVCRAIPFARDLIFIVLNYHALTNCKAVKSVHIAPVARINNVSGIPAAGKQIHRKLHSDQH